MRKFRQFAVVPLLGVMTLFATGCDDSSTGNSGDPLEPDEAGFMALLFIQMFSQTLPDFGEDDEFEGTIEVTAACPFDSGSFAVDGTYEGEQDGDDVSVTVELFIELLNCLIVTDDSELTLDSDPGVDMVVDAASVDEVTSFDISIVGGVEFETDDDRSGRCALNLNLDITQQSGEDPEIEASGSLCGVQGSEVDFEEIFASPA